MTGSPEFVERHRDDDGTHLFRLHDHDSGAEPGFGDLVEQCLAAWRLTAGAFRRVTATGFDGSRLNALGTTMLPPVPPENSHVTRNPYVTDVTEILAVRILAAEMPELEIPHPRVLHKEALGLQHHGIDLVGFLAEDGRHVLALIEVMASVQAAHPPKTVTDHYEQLLTQTLSELPPKRLTKDLAFIHDECDDPKAKDVINAFITAIHDGTLDGEQLAVAVLIRAKDGFDAADWGPFRDNVSAFENAPIKSRVVFHAVECDCKFAALLEKVVKAAGDGSSA